MMNKKNDSRAKIHDRGPSALRQERMRALLGLRAARRLRFAPWDQPLNRLLSLY